MKKSELISILESIPGDPDIVGNHPTVKLMWYAKDRRDEQSNRSMGVVCNLIFNADKRGSGGMGYE
jgi:hypothetical protein